jgi:hypothetical protein
MKFTHLLIALLTVSLIGCTTDGEGSNPGDAGSIKKDCDYTSGLPVTDCTPPTKLSEFTIKAKSPDGLPGDFYLDDSICGDEPNPGFTKAKFLNASEFELKVEDFKVKDKLCLFFIRDKHLFVPREITFKPSDNKAVFNFDWSSPNSWGLAPSGLYIGDEDEEYDIKTSISGNMVLIKGISCPAPVDKNKFSVDDENCGSIEGVISDDFKTITYQRVLDIGTIIKDTLTLDE